MMETLKRMGARLAEIMAQRGVSERDLALLTGLSRTSMQNYKSGRNELGPERGDLIANALECEYGDLLAALRSPILPRTVGVIEIGHLFPYQLRRSRLSRRLRGRWRDRN